MDEPFVSGQSDQQDVYDSRPDTEITEIVVSNLSEITDYTQVIVGLQCVLIGLVLALIVAKVWGKL